MMKRATAVLVLLALCGLLPAAAQEPQEEMAAEAKKMAEEAEGMVEEAEGMAEEAAGMAEEAKKMMAGDGRSLDEVLASHYEALGATDS